MPVLCQVCNRPLRSPVSIAVGVGPVCSKRVNQHIQNAMPASETTTTAGERYMLAIVAAQNAYRERIRRRRQNPVEQEENPTHTISGVESVTRGRFEDITVEFSNNEHAIVRSESGQVYSTTADSCSCPHYTYRLQHTNGQCRHIQAFQAALQGSNSLSLTDIEGNRRQAESRSIEVTEQLHIQNRPQFSQIDWEEEAARESVLNIWRENRAFDGIYMSEDDQAWNDLRQEAMQEWNYRYENVLGGTGNSFGVELEFEFPLHISKEHVSRVLYEAEILESPNVLNYHSRQSVGPGFWRLERDGSLDNGLELVSPVLFDTPEHWQQIERATHVLRELGAYTNQNTGGHIHIGIAPLDHRTYSWQRLARIGLGYEKIFYRMGGADSLSYVRTGTPGKHRGTYYNRPIPESATRIRGTDSAREAREKLSNDERYTMFNPTNIDSFFRPKPTVEMRYPNGSLDHRQIQAQVQVANAVIHQAGIIRNDSPESRFTPGLRDFANHIKRNAPTPNGYDEKYLRRFLDVLGNKEDRLAATWLYLRGSV